MGSVSCCLLWTSFAYSFTHYCKFYGLYAPISSASSITSTLALWHSISVQQWNPMPNWNPINSLTIEGKAFLRPVPILIFQLTNLEKTINYLYSKMLENSEKQLVLTIQNIHLISYKIFTFEDETSDFSLSGSVFKLLQIKLLSNEYLFQFYLSWIFWNTDGSKNLIGHPKCYLKMSGTLLAFTSLHSGCLSPKLFLHHLYMDKIQLVESSRLFRPHNCGCLLVISGGQTASMYVRV